MTTTAKMHRLPLSATILSVLSFVLILSTRNTACAARYTTSHSIGNTASRIISSTGRKKSTTQEVTSNKSPTTASASILAFLSHPTSRQSRRLCRFAFSLQSPSSCVQHQLHDRHQHHDVSQSSSSRRHNYFSSSLLLLASTNNNGNNNQMNDEECDLQKLYQQVQEDDSEWYYQTFSKLLGEEEDPIELLDCGKDDGASSDVVADSNNNGKLEDGPDNGKGSETESGSSNDTVSKTGGGKGESEYVGASPMMDIEVVVAEVDTTNVGGDKVTDNTNEKEETAPERRVAALQNEIKVSSISDDRQPSSQQVEEVEGVLDKIQQTIPVSKSNGNGDVREQDSPEIKSRNDDDIDVEFDGENYGNYYDESSTEDTNDRDNDVSTNQKQPQPANQEQSSDSPPPPPPVSPPPPMVRIRNRFTNQYENITPLPTLLTMGYSIEDISVLRPQVLELIVEDSIPRPRRGIPERWMSGNSKRYDGYDDEEEDEDDEDYGWEVLVVYPKISKERLSQKEEMERDDDDSSTASAYDKNDDNEIELPSSRKNQEMELEPSSSKKEELGGVGSNSEKVYPGGSPNAVPKAKQPSSLSDNKNPNIEVGPGQVSESWGPFSSSRITNEQGGEKGSSSDNDEVRQFDADRNIEAGQRIEEEQRPNRMADEFDAAETKRDYESKETMANYSDSSESSRRRQPIADGYNDARPWQDRQPTSSSQRRPITDAYDKKSRRSYSEPPRPRSSSRQRRPPPPPSDRRRELSIDRGDDNYDYDPPPNKFWMDLPTFQNFLRTEAKLRLKILGPDWKESVLDESRWRFDLYKRWLYLLDDGVGENPLYEYGDRPRSSKERRTPRNEREFDLPTSRQQRSQRPRARGGDEMYGRPPRRRQSNSEPQEEGGQRPRARDDDELYGRSRRRRQSNSEPLEKGGRRPRAKDDDELYGQLPRRRQSNSEPQKEGGQRPKARDDDEFYGRSPRRRQSNSEPQEEEEEEDEDQDKYTRSQDRQMESRSYDSDPPQRRRSDSGSWKNFSDLEDSLTRSSQSNLRRTTSTDTPRDYTRRGNREESSSRRDDEYM